ncbi:MAG TPA: MBL fold metallo-hydrolase, partial [Chitinophagaceae bacterium]|nr:MBL fold metallo-hydrolase [Chitinophagaceae bacterium]
LTVNAFEAAANETEALILDTRAPEVFAQGFIPNSINIGIDGNFAPWVGTLIQDIKQPILIVADEGRAEEVITRLARVGYDYCIGYLEGGFDAWKAANKEVDYITSISVEAFEQAVSNIPSASILDVRKKSEFDSEHLLHANNLPLDFINERMAEIPMQVPTYVHCAGGYRSMIFISILKARGDNHLIDVQGGFKAIKAQTHLPVTEYVCPTTML